MSGKQPNLSTRLAEGLRQRPVGSWQTDVDWVKTQHPRAGQPGSALVGALLERHPIPDETAGPALLSWLISSVPDPSQHPIALYDANIRSHACQTLARDAIHAGKFTWLLWAMDQSPDPAGTLLYTLLLERYQLPDSAGVRALDQEQRGAWNTFWWRAAAESGNWHEKGHTLFDMGLHFTWDCVEIDWDQLGAVLQHAQAALDMLQTWQVNPDHVRVVVEMKRELLGREAHAAVRDDGPGGRLRM